MLATHHALWRDEVRALTIALQGGSVPAMLAQLQGEGHPALWYLILRGLHAVVPAPGVLPFASIAVASAAALLLALRSPFSRPVVALLLFSGLLLFEYSVMQRNYGISVLLLWVIAVRYPAARDGGLWLGALLLLLANTNVHSALLVAAFLLFWLLDLVRAHGRRWGRPHAWFVANAALAAAGVAACALTVYPPANDAVLSDGMRAGALAVAGRILNPAASFGALLDDPALHLAGGPLIVVQAALSALLYASLLGLRRSLPAMVAGLVALLGLSTFFTLVYGGSYRHEGLWLAFMVTLYWIEAGSAPLPAGLGASALALLLVLQLPAGLRPVAGLLLGRPPLSRSRDLGRLIASRPDLRDAIIIGEPESVVEALPYYVPNATYMLRQAQFGSVVRFARSVRMELSLSDLLATAQALASQAGRPVLILMEPPLDPAQPARSMDDGYGRHFTIDPAAVRAFLAATTLLTRFGPAQTDESYGVYLLDRPPPAGHQ